MSGSSIYAPWEHPVCSRCLKKRGQYCLHLATVVCLEPDHRDHKEAERIPMIVDAEYTMSLCPVRLLPYQCFEFSRNFSMCSKVKQSLPCPNGNCRYAHSELERTTWNVKKKLLRELKDNLKLRKLLESVPHSTYYPEICSSCYTLYNQSVWLLWLHCIDPQLHKDHSTIRVSVALNRKRVMKVKEPPHNASLVCNQAETKEEFEYWKYHFLKNKFKKYITEIDSYIDWYGYPLVIPSDSWQLLIDEELSEDNYSVKFHLLLYLDELASSRKLVTECDGKYTLQVIPDGHIVLSGMSDDSMDYAVNHSGAIVLNLLWTSLNITHFKKYPYINGLVLEGLPDWFYYNQISFASEYSAHFDFNYSVIQYHHMALDSLSDDIIQKLFPLFEMKRHRTDSISLLHGKQSLDEEYQTEALINALRCQPTAPFLILGPFGTGKSRLLVYAALNILCDSNSKVLVCTHLDRGADYFCENYYHESKICKNLIVSPVKIVAPFNHQPTAKYTTVSTSEMCYLLATNPYFAISNRLFVTTFNQAFDLYETCRDIGYQFTHILIDEGAQTTEPEVICALSLASQHTKIIIAGDNKQVGPSVRVNDEIALKGGLGESLLMRLCSHYNAIGITDTHSATLLTNYRCHASIVTLSSSLYYEHTLLPRSKNSTHPRAPYPLVFIATSLEEKDIFSDVPAQDYKEVDVLLNEVLLFLKSWPSNWQFRKYPTIGILASTKKQIEWLRSQCKSHLIEKYPRLLKKFKLEILASSDIQGEEFLAVFASTIEPTTSSGCLWDPARSICNDAVFNTVITRSQCLVVCTGNPFRLIHFNKQMNSRCWTEYIQRCIASQSFQVHVHESDLSQELMNGLYHQIESYHDDLIKKLDFSKVDDVIERYIADIHERNEYRSSFGLIKGNPNIKHMGSCKIVSKKFYKKAEGILTFRSYRNASCKINDGTVIKINSLANRKFAFDGDIVSIEYNSETLRGRVVINDDTYIRTNTEHFGEHFLCVVDVISPTLFLPTDRRHPNFSNLPHLVKTYGNNDVVCFDPVSIERGCPKVSQLIPFEVAKDMLFIICYLGWKPRFKYPLGIAIKAFPPCTSLTAETLLKVHYTVPRTANEYWDPQPFDYSNINYEVFDNVFTIDPESAVYLDDALSCEQCSDQPGKYKIGIHITDVSCLVPIDSPLDEQAKERLHSCYSELSRKCTLRMLPDCTSKAASLLPNKQIKGFSLVTAVDVKDNEVVDIVTAPVIRHSLIISKRKMSYKEAESILIGRNDSDDERDALVILWKFAKYLRKLRLGSFYFSDDLNTNHSVLSETLVEELMIFTNTQVAQFLVKNNFPVIMRAQEPPDQIKLKAFVDKHKSDLLCFPNTQKLVYQFYPEHEEDTSEFSFELSFNISDIVLSSEDSISVVNYLVNQINHPKYLAVHNELISLKQKSYYYLHQGNASECRHHDDLCLEKYTQFTSPIRRYVDIIIQRLLTAVLNSLQIMPYNERQLNELVNLLNEQKWRKFKMHLDEIYLAYQVKEGSQEYLCTVVYRSDRSGEINISFIDPILHSIKKIWPIHIQCLKIHKDNFDTQDNSIEDGSLYAGKWKIRMCSLKGNLTPLASRTNRINTYCKLEANILVSNDGSRDINTVWKKQPHKNDEDDVHKPVLSQQWNNLLSKLFDVSEKNNRSELEDNFKAIKSSIEQCMHNETLDDSFASSTCSITFSPLCVTYIELSLQPKEVIKVWLTSTIERNLISPTIQLIELDPMVRICVQHNNDPAKTFAGRLTKSVANKVKYEDEEEYHQLWQPLLVAEAATDTTDDNDIMILHDVKIEWPQLDFKYDSTGRKYYYVPERQKIVINFPKEFIETSLPFFYVSIGCLLCIRYKETDEGNSCSLQDSNSTNRKRTVFVLHMVIESMTDVSNDRKELIAKTLTIGFVDKISNWISERLRKCLTNGLCEVQLIPVTAPHKRAQTCLKYIYRGETNNELVKEIAFGSIQMPTVNITRQLEGLTLEIEQEVFQLWTETTSIVVELNQSQKNAIRCAFNNKFSLIHGPPGTGKSVTGAHLAYALFMKLKATSNEESESIDENDKKKCIMYCGPSHKAVDVVLDVLIKPGNPLVKHGIKVVRLYSKAVEEKEFPGPKYDSDIFPKYHTDATCKPEYGEYALHHLIRKRNPEIEEYQRKYDDMKKDGLIPSHSDMNHYRKLIHDAELAELQRADIVLCTCSEGLSHRVISSLKPKAVIIDECAMCTEIDTLTPLCCSEGLEKVVLIGDHKQLQPVIKYKQAERLGLGRSLFERYASNKYIPQCMLNIQYRMHPSICEFPSNHFYERKLLSDESTRRRILKFNLDKFWPQSKLPMVFCDVKGPEKHNNTGFHHEIRVGLGSKYNVHQAICAIKVAIILMTHFNVSHEDLAILTPYSAQREEVRYQWMRNKQKKLEEIQEEIDNSERKIETIKQDVRCQNNKIERVRKSSIARNTKRNKVKHITKEIGRLEGSICQIKDKILKNKQKLEIIQKVEMIQVKTITESQGSEYSIVILTTVRSKQLIDNDVDIKGDLGFITNPNQINVGLTRCKNGLIIIGNSKLLEYDDDIWKELLTHYKNIHCFTDGTKFLNTLRSSD